MLYGLRLNPDIFWSSRERGIGTNTYIDLTWPGYPRRKSPARRQSGEVCGPETAALFLTTAEDARALFFHFLIDTKHENTKLLVPSLPKLGTYLPTYLT